MDCQVPPGVGFDPQILRKTQIRQGFCNHGVFDMVTA